MSKHDSCNRLLLIGIDGAGDILHQYFPLCKLLISDHYSVVPYNSIASWTSIFTGLKPEDHGLLDFLMYYNNGIVLPSEELLFSNTKVKQLLWYLPKTIGLFIPALSKTILSNNKILVPGIPYLEYKKILPAIMLLTRDPNVIEAVKNIEYSINGISFLVKQGRLKDAASILLNALKLKLKIARLAYEKFKQKEFRIFIVIFQEIDLLRHFLYEGRAVEYGMMIILGFIKEVMNELSDNDCIIITSDHGMTKKCKTFYINYFLEQYGYIDYTPSDPFEIKNKNFKAIAISSRGSVTILYGNKAEKAAKEFIDTYKDIVNQVFKIHFHGQEILVIEADKDTTFNPWKRPYSKEPLENNVSPMKHADHYPITKMISNKVVCRGMQTCILKTLETLL